MHKLQCLAQQIVMVRHLCPFRISSLLLFRLAAKIEIRVQAPILDWPDLIEESRNDAARHFGKSLLASRCVG